VTYVADGLDLGGTFEGDVEREGLDSTTLALEELIEEQDLLQIVRYHISAYSHRGWRRKRGGGRVHREATQGGVQDEKAA
jgi:hypothetical protein